MPAQAARSAICVVVLERQGARVLIAVKLIPDSNASSAASRLLFVDRNQALDAIRTFMETFARRSQ
jgi:hypothetical protein